MLNYRREKGEEAYAAVINRLDRPVSGLVLFAKIKRGIKIEQPYARRRLL